MFSPKVLQRQSKICTYTVQYNSSFFNTKSETRIAEIVHGELVQIQKTLKNVPAKFSRSTVTSLVRHRLQDKSPHMQVRIVNNTSCKTNISKPQALSANEGRPVLGVLHEGAEHQAFMGWILHVIALLGKCS